MTVPFLLEHTAARTWLRKLTRVVRHHGVRGAARSAVALAVLRVKALSPARRRARQRDAAREAAFDHARGVDTAGRIAIAELDGIVGRHADDAQRYQGADPERLRTVLTELHIDPAGYAFVDLGCGKGRALLVAAELPFRSVTGVEFAPALHRVAQVNIAADRGPRRCRDVRAALGDAVETDFPAGPLVVFMFNPFGAQVMRPVLERLRAASNDRPGTDLHILYWNPELAGLVEASGFARVGGGPEHSHFVRAGAAPS